MKVKRHLYLTIFVLSGILTLILLQKLCLGSERKQSLKEDSKLASSSQSKYAYFMGWKGQVVKVDKENLAIAALWYLSRIEGIGNLLPPYSENYRNDWGIESVVYDRNLERFYAVFPKEDQKSSITTHYLMALQLPLLQMASSLPIVSNVPQSPRVLVTPDGRQLYVNFRESRANEKKYYDILDVYDTSSFKKIKTFSLISEMENVAFGSEPNLLLTTGAFISADGNAIYDHDRLFIRKIVFSGNKVLQEKIAPLQIIEKSQRPLLRDFESLYKPNAKKTASYTIADSKNGYLLLRLSDQVQKKKVMFSLAIPSGRITSPIDLPFQAKAYLTPDGSRVVLEEIETETKKERIGGVETEVVKKTTATGKFELFDLNSGKLVRSFSKKEELAGNKNKNMPLCFAPDNSVMFYAANEKLYAFSLVEDKAPVKINADFSFGEATTCFFADR